MVTGRSDKYWAAACFNDDFFDNTDDQRLSSEDDTEHVAGSTDPITFKEEGKTESPRGYALAALASIVLKVADYHKDIEDRFEASLNRHVSLIRILRICTAWRRNLVHGCAAPDNVYG